MTKLMRRRRRMKSHKMMLRLVMSKRNKSSKRMKRTRTETIKTMSKTMKRQKTLKPQWILEQCLMPSLIVANTCCLIDCSSLSGQKINP